MPGIQPLPGTLHLHSSPFFSPQSGTYPNMMVFDNNTMDMEIMTWCKWRTFVPFFFYGTFQFQYTIKLSAQNTLSLRTCQIGDIFVVVHTFSAFKSSMTTLFFIGTFAW
jgi:hypothetical protein